MQKVERNWFSTEIEEAIKVRKMYKRKRRNERNADLKMFLVHSVLSLKCQSS